jgi:hypothetical protein
MFQSVKHGIPDVLFGRGHFEHFVHVVNRLGYLGYSATVRAVSSTGNLAICILVIQFGDPNGGRCPGTLRWQLFTKMSDIGVPTCLTGAMFYLAYLPLYGAGILIYNR